MKKILHPKKVNFLKALHVKLVLSYTKVCLTTAIARSERRLAKWIAKTVAASPFEIWRDLLSVIDRIVHNNCAWKTTVPDFGCGEYRLHFLGRWIYKTRTWRSKSSIARKWRTIELPWVQFLSLSTILVFSHWVCDVRLPTNLAYWYGSP